MADDAVALVRAYLHLNGYFTVTEYPVLETRKCCVPFSGGSASAPPWRQAELDARYVSKYLFTRSSANVLRPFRPRIGREEE